MAGRPNDGKTRVNIAHHNPIGKLKTTTGSEFGDIERMLHQIGVTIIRVGIGPQDVFPQLLQIKGGMDGFDSGRIGSFCLT